MVILKKIIKTVINREKEEGEKEIGLTLIRKYVKKNRERFSGLERERKIYIIYVHIYHI